MAAALAGAHFLMQLNLQGSVLGEAGEAALAAGLAARTGPPLLLLGLVGCFVPSDEGGAARLCAKAGLDPACTVWQDPPVEVPVAAEDGAGWRVTRARQMRRECVLCREVVSASRGAGDGAAWSDDDEAADQQVDQGGSGMAADGGLCPKCQVWEQNVAAARGAAMDLG
jgi:hypothetical protein